MCVVSRRNWTNANSPSKTRPRLRGFARRGVGLQPISRRHTDHPHVVQSDDGIYPYGSLTLSGATLYGIDSQGETGGYGSVFSVSTNGGTPTVLATFSATDGEYPRGSLTLGGSTFYGMTNEGGASGDGTIFSLPVTGGTPTVLASFNGANGARPYDNDLTLSGSTLYGMTPSGGANNAGEIFSIPTTGGTPTVLASFNGTDGSTPYGDLTLIGSTLYGMTSAGGPNGAGVIFSLPVTGGTPTVLASFNGTDGRAPWDTLTLSADGSTFFGTTLYGGANGAGVIFGLPVTGGTPTVLASLSNASGEYPTGSLTLMGSTLYGTTTGGGACPDGTVFSIPTTGGTPTVLAAFNGPNGDEPWGGLTPSANGATLYGTTSGETYGTGTVFALHLTPEPSSVALLGFGAIGVAAAALRRRLRGRHG